MKKLAILPLSIGCVFTAFTTHAIDLKQSKVTQVVNDVQIISAANQQEKNAAVNDIFSMPDILRTGAASRAELVAADETVTRVGANTIFSFDPATRTIDLKQGSLLFHSPHGMGGGTIHTGSATASVLGTTLIVTTTPSGGMKVLDLEGSVEVKFLNGLKQNLAPGHMTFVLPGGKQLSPIIVFRLDAVAEQSLLVTGFHANLASMPLIQEQIDKQLELIKSGKATDTGLEVGSDANSQVLDLNTLQAALDQSFVNSASVIAAFSFDATINQPSLTDASIPTPPARVFLDKPFLLTGNTFYTGQPFYGFAARNIFFNTIHQQPLSVDLSAYASLPFFDIVAKNNLTLADSVDFDGLASSDSIIFSLVAGNQLLVAAGATINANVINFNWQTPGDLTLDGVRIQNFVGNTSFGIGGDFTMKNFGYLQTAASLSVRTPDNISITHSTLIADSMFLTSALGTIDLESDTVNLTTFGTLTAHTDLTIKNDGFTSSTASPLYGFSFNSDSGSVNISGTSIQGSALSVSAGDSITLDGSDQSFNVAKATFNAPNLITMNNANFQSIANLNAVANTITVMGSTFNAGNVYNFGVGNGTANVNNGVVSGEANFINDKIGTTALTLANQVDQHANGVQTTAGIHVYTK